jgi:hypothetical protein
MNIWFYNNKPYVETPEEYQGFVYVITEISTGKKYVGKKNFWRPKTLPITKKRKRRVRTRVESDWQNYYGSSKHLTEAIENTFADNYKREILHLCKTKGDMSYYEAKEQFDRDVLLDDSYYNNFIGCKIHGNHLS